MPIIVKVSRGNIIRMRGMLIFHRFPLLLTEVVEINLAQNGKNPAEESSPHEHEIKKHTQVTVLETFVTRRLMFEA